MYSKPLPRALLAALGISVSSCVADVGMIPSAEDSGVDATSPAGECDGKPVGSIERRVRYGAPSVPANQQCMAQDQSRECGENGQWTDWTGDYEAESCSVAGLAGCDDLPHGTQQTRERYELESVPFGQECKKQSQSRTCEDGAWTNWSGSYGQELCSVSGAASCDGTPHGEQQARIRYASLTVPYGSSCLAEMQTRNCANGEFSAWSGTFTEESCRVLGALSCGNSPHGTIEKRTRFETALVTSGECKSEEQSRTCNEGEWSSWTGTFTEEICDVEGAKRCGSTLHGEEEKRLRYENAVVPYEAICVSQLQARVCNDGTFGAWNGTYEAETCTKAPPADCDGAKHGDKRTRERYASATVPYGTSCLPEQQESTCDNGAWTDWTGMATHETCSVSAPADCDTAKHGDMESRIRYASSSVIPPATCEQETQTRTCNNGTWTNFSGSYTAESCSVAPASCDGVPHGGTRTRTRFAASTAPFAGCVSEEQVSTCDNGTWGDFTGTNTFEQCTPALCVSTAPVPSEFTTSNNGTASGVILMANRATDFRCSPNGQYQFGFGEEGELRLRNSMGVVVWSQPTSKTAVLVNTTQPVLITAFRVVIQPDGNLVVRSEKAYYNSGTSGSSTSSLWSAASNKEAGSKLTVNDNGTITIVGPSTTVHWTRPEP